jgi:erythromycin esterase-like protein
MRPVTYLLCLLPLLGLAQIQTGGSALVCGVDRPDFTAEYASLDAALNESRFEDVFQLALPDATVLNGNHKTLMRDAIAQMKAALSQGGRATQETRITSVEVTGSEAKVARRTQSTIVIGGRRHAGVDTALDTWVCTAGGWRLGSSKSLSSREIMPPTDEATARAVAAELKALVHPIRGRVSDPEGDLEPLGQAIGDARIVALGEATHGTSEFNQLKARMIEYLMGRKGFTVLAVEANWPETLAIDRYVKTGEGDPKALLSQLQSWPLQTGDLLGTIEWMRAYNRRATGPKLAFTSFDMQRSDAALAQVVAYVRRAAPEQLGAVEQCYRLAGELGAKPGVPDGLAAAAAEKAKAVIRILEEDRTSLRLVSSERDWENARRCAQVVVQAMELKVPGRTPGYRDEMMANNLISLLDGEHGAEKSIIWAHNGHVTFGPSLGIRPMAFYLRARFGKAFYSIGFSVAGGEVRANGSNGFGVYAMPVAAPGSGDGVLGLSGLSMFFLDISKPPKSTVLGKWLTEPHLFYSVGGRWNDVPEDNTSVFAISECFDGVVFVRDGHASTVVH